MTVREARISVASLVFMSGVLSTGLQAGCGLPALREPVSMKELRTSGMVLQTHESTCGAAALASLMRMFRVPATEEEIIQIAFKDTPPMRGEGKKRELRELTLEDLELAARKLGFKVVSLKAETGEDAVKAVRELRPVIARLKLYAETLHFVLISDLQDDWVYVSDPGYGNFKIPLRQFYRAWEEGDRYFLTISKRPFYVWTSGARLAEDAERFQIRRGDLDRLSTHPDLTPARLYGAARGDLTLMNSLSR